MRSSRSQVPRMKVQFTLHTIGLLVLLVASNAAAGEPPDWTDVGPILGERCVMCHSDKGAGLGLRLDSYEAAIAGSLNGPVLLPGDAENSELVRRLRGQSQPRMPLLSYALPEDQIELITRWIDAGLGRGD